MKKENVHKRFNAFYNYLIKQLLKSPFRSFAAFFSHGGTHFLFLLLIGIISAYIYIKNDQEKITPHNIGVYVGNLSDFKEEFQKTKLEKETIDNLNIDVLLNSDSIRKITEGKYSNGIAVSFDGKAIKRVLRKHYKENGIYKLQSETVLFDSVLVFLNSSPNIRHYGMDISMDPVLGEGKVWDSITNGYKEKIYIASDTHVNFFHVKYSDGSVGAYIAPRQYEIGKTRHHVTFYSDELGVKKNDPYYYYYISFPNCAFSGALQISFRVSDLASNFSMDQYSKNKNLQYSFIYPQPDIIGNGYIKFFSPEKIDQIRRNRGVVIQAVDIDTQNRQNRTSFILTVLFGTFVALLIDIFIQLIRELRRLQVRNSEKK